LGENYSKYRCSSKKINRKQTIKEGNLKCSGSSKTTSTGSAIAMSNFHCTDLQQVVPLGSEGAVFDSVQAFLQNKSVEGAYLSSLPSEHKWRG
jgi:hypothetical protein